MLKIALLAVYAQKGRLTPFGRICSKQAQNRVKTACFEAKKGSFSPVYVRGSEQDLSRMGRFGVQKGVKIDPFGGPDQLRSPNVNRRK